MTVPSMAESPLSDRSVVWTEMQHRRPVGSARDAKLERQVGEEDAPALHRDG